MYKTLLCIVFIGFAPIAMASPEAVPTTTTATAKEPKIVCRRVERIGTRLGGKKICMPKTEWDAAARDGRDATEKHQTQGMTSSSGN
jgi:hypothetical protein